MRKQIQTISTKLEALLSQAEARSGSEVEATAARYDHVVENLQTAIDALEEATNLCT